jgi:hypothetical protein
MDKITGSLMSKTIFQQIGYQKPYPHTTCQEYDVLIKIFAEEQSNISQYRFTDREMEIHWEIILSAKGAMQDCWELFSQQ